MFLLAKFGDPEVAATLIRSSKIRNRSMFSRIFYGGFFTMLAVLLAYAGVSAFFYMGKPNPSVDYLGEMYALQPESDLADHAWEIYREPWTKHEFSEGKGGRFMEIFYQHEGFEDHMRLMQPTDGEQWEGAIEKLANSQDLLDAFRTGGLKPRLGLKVMADPNDYSREDRAALFPMDDPDEFIENRLNSEVLTPESQEVLEGAAITTLLPHIQSFRQGVRVLHVDTRWAIEQGDTERATQNIEAIFGMGRQAADHPFLVCGLVGIACHGIGYNIIDEIVENHYDVFSEEEFERMQIAVGRDSIHDFVKLEGERATLKDCIQRMYTDDGNGDGRITPVGVNLMVNFHVIWGSQHDQQLHEALERTFEKIAAPVSLAVLATRKQMTEKIDELMDMVDEKFHLPYHEADLDDIEETIADFGMQYLLIDRLFPAYQQVRNGMFRTIGNQSGVEAALAALRYEKINGHPPESLEELVGEYLDEMPKDVINGQPLNYVRTEEGFKIYSVGPDGDDDGGCSIMLNEDGTFPAESLTQEEYDEYATRPMPADQFTLVLRKKHRGDWVIWPRLSGQGDEYDARASMESSDGN